MNCKTIRDDILLADSGELSPDRRQQLSAHLESCTDCAAFAKMAQSLTEAAREGLPQDTPHPSVMVAIREAATARRRTRWIGFPVGAVRLVACAATLALVSGALWLTVFSDSPDGADSRVAALSTMVAMVSESVNDDATQLTVVDDDQDLKAVARQLLEMEGFDVDDLFDDEVLSLFEEPAPTTTQWHRTPSSPAQKCV